MESRLTSSGRSSQEPQHWTFSTKFKQTYKESTSHLKTSVIEFSSWQCSMPLNWKGKITKILLLLPQGRSKNFPQILTMDTGHSWDPEKNASSIEDMQPIMVASGILRASQVVENFENWGHPVFQVNPLGPGILKKKNKRDTIHFNEEYGNINLLYTTVHVANQLWIYGAVTKWCGTKSHREKIILICVWGWHQICWKEAKYSSDVESTQ